jgi:hypothetical protein
MSAELTPQEKPLLRDMRNLRLAYDKVKYTRGAETELMIQTEDSTSSFERIDSSLMPVENIDKTKRILDAFVEEIVPGKTRIDLEAEFNLKPEKTEKDYVSTEWKTKDESVVLGVKVFWDHNGESFRSWYLRNTLKKPGVFFSFLNKK